MLLTVFFQDAGAPAVGLTPTIDVWNSGGTLVVNGSSMTEVAGGFYYFNFSSYDESQDYFIRADAGPSLALTDRYVATTNEVGQVTNQLTVQDTNLSYILGLVQSNFRMTNQSYDGNGNMTSATITIYPTAADVDAQTNAIASYAVSATYGGTGQLTNYQVKKN